MNIKCLFFLSICLLTNCNIEKQKKTLQKEKNIPIKNKLKPKDIQKNNTTLNSRENTYKSFKNKLVERINDDQIWVYNCHNSGFTSSSTIIKINKKLEVVSAYYNRRTDYIDLNNKTKYKVLDSKIKFNINPFYSNDSIEIDYKLNVNEIKMKLNDTLSSKAYPYIGKLKNIVNTDKEEIFEYKKKFGIINNYGAYKYYLLEDKPKILTNTNALKGNIKKLFGIKNIWLNFSINKQGEIINESLNIKASNLSEGQRMKMKKMILEKVKYSSAKIGNTSVKCEIMLRL